MISHKTPRRSRIPRMPKNIERLYKEGKCRDCAVVVTRMDFAKILGKFTKVKIQYESNSSPKTKKSEVTSPNSNARLKSNENGMVHLHRNAYKPHPVKDLNSNKKVISSTPRQANNVLKENNRLKRTPIIKDKNSNLEIVVRSPKSGSCFKQYGIVFVNPTQKRTKNELISKTSLDELLPLMNKSILPSEDWCIEFSPLKDEPTDDKVYDRIAAELEDLMYSETPVVKPEATDVSENKADEFPSIMDILNDNSNDGKETTNQSNSVEFKPNLESSDVEAMLLGKSGAVKESPTPMEVDASDVTNLIEDVAQLNAIQETVPNQDGLEAPSTVTEEFQNPHSPSILDEALQKGIEEHLPVPIIQVEPEPPKNNSNNNVSPKSTTDVKTKEETDQKLPSINTSNSKKENADSENVSNTNKKILQRADITHVTFKKRVDGTCQKSVICPKSMKYNVEIEGKQVELLGAPKFISSLEDLQVLLQIVDDTELKSLYVIY